MSHAEAPPAAPLGRLLLLGMFVAGFATFWLLGGPQWLSLDTLREHRDGLLAWTEQQRLLAVVLALAAYTLAVALSVPGAVVLSLATGLLFGRWLGTAIIVAAATLGATLVFLAARYLFADWARRRLPPRAQTLIAGFDRNAFNYLLFLRLVPVFPFWLVNLAPAFTQVQLRTYVVGTALGIIPGSFVFANLGRQLGRIKSLDELLSPGTLVALALLGLLALVPVLVNRTRTPATKP